MYGDYEAQRHWMEITNHLPLNRWYTYDLQFWGLDYPPLTAYHSWLCGFMWAYQFPVYNQSVWVRSRGSIIDPNWFAFESSRGLENEGSKLFMRATVVVSDLLIYVPSLIYFVKTWHSNRTRRTQVRPQLIVRNFTQVYPQSLALLSLLLQPSLLLIDFGHFQYNSVMLGGYIFSIRLYQIQMRTI